MRGRSSPNSTHSLLPVHARSTITSYNTRGHTALSGLAATHVESIRVRRRGVTSKSPWHSWTERGRLPRHVHDGKRACPRAERDAGFARRLVQVQYNKWTASRATTCYCKLCQRQVRVRSVRHHRGMGATGRLRQLSFSRIWAR